MEEEGNIRKFLEQQAKLGSINTILLHYGDFVNN